ncbi:hypothetical protein EVAR_39049_1 [Eumeta japonica]|uniref:Uncharacterized protein n=1 Tax=Eumeta variegata TaxID=151549 RepID=A0A4C1WR03_EUMVA|nr:hypothetical protein EVAR_39049_1 [Eumeta japonica]
MYPPVLEEEGDLRRPQTGPGSAPTPRRPPARSSALHVLDGRDESCMSCVQEKAPRANTVTPQRRRYSAGRPTPEARASSLEEARHSRRRGDELRGNAGGPGRARATADSRQNNKTLKHPTRVSTRSRAPCCEHTRLSRESRAGRLEGPRSISKGRQSEYLPRHPTLITSRSKRALDPPMLTEVDDVSRNAFHRTDDRAHSRTKALRPTEVILSVFEFQRLIQSA